MPSWMSDRRTLLTVSILLILLNVAWYFRYETYNVHHRNRYTGVTCFVNEECW